MEYSNEKIHFLDILIMVNECTSFHPDGMINNILYGQFMRLRRICSKEEDFRTKA